MWLSISWPSIIRLRGCSDTCCESVSAQELAWNVEAFVDRPAISSVIVVDTKPVSHAEAIELAEAFHEQIYDGIRAESCRKLSHEQATSSKDTSALAWHVENDVGLMSKCWSGMGEGFR
jgi:hypothetical protein